MAEVEEGDVLVMMVVAVVEAVVEVEVVEVDEEEGVVAAVVVVVVGNFLRVINKSSLSLHISEIKISSVPR